MIFRIFSVGKKAATSDFGPVEEETGTYADGYLSPEHGSTPYRRQEPRFSSHERDYGRRTGASRTAIGLA
ncbi:hypothetical protein [Oryzifoliimicrobium ureilyticus]|uniref:hypothetical protein n=1 Tax=Oryzifoliimicrobium ureilyticus TaxID=3113724 RepID=UPI00307621EE